MTNAQNTRARCQLQLQRSNKRSRQAGRVSAFLRGNPADGCLAAFEVGNFPYVYRKASRTATWSPWTNTPHPTCL